MVVKTVEQYTELLLVKGAEDRGVRISLENGIYRDIKEFRIPGFLMKIAPVSESQLPVYQDAEETIDQSAPRIPAIVRTAARVLRAKAEYKANNTRKNRLKLREECGVLDRNLRKELEYRVQRIVNTRDSENMSSMLGVGIPAWHDEFFVTGKLQMLEANEVAISPEMARKMVVSDGAWVILARQPITDLMPVTVRVIEGYADAVIGIHPGQVEFPGIGTCTVADRLGGDFDGDMYYLISFHNQECIEAITNFAASYWEGARASETVGDLFTKEDHMPCERSDREIAGDKFQQKDSVPFATLSTEKIAAAMVARPGFLPGGFEDARKVKERAIETAMDLKKGTGQNPMLLPDILDEKELWASNTESALTEQGFDVTYIKRLLKTLADKDTSLHKVASDNFAWSGFRIGGAKMMEKLSDTLKGSRNPAGCYIEALLGRKRYAPASWPRNWGSTPRSRELSDQSFTATWDQSHEQIHVVCGSGTFDMPTIYSGKAIRLSESKVVLFRPTVYVSVEPINGHRDDSGSWVIDGVAVGKKIVLLNNWGELLNTLSMQVEYKWGLHTIREESETVEASRLLEAAVRKMLGDLFADYKMDDQNIRSWSTMAGCRKYVVLHPDIPAGRQIDIVAIKSEIKMAAGDYLMSKGLIEKLCGTISGNPGSAFYMKTSPGETFATRWDPLRHLIADKRLPVSNAISNLADLDTDDEVSFAAPLIVSKQGERVAARVRPSMVELWACAARLQGAGAVMISRSAADKLKIRVPVSTSGEHEVHVLQSGDKIQGFLDLKGVVVVVTDAKMPLIKFGDGTWVRAELCFDMESKSHGMLLHSHLTLALTAAAYKQVQTTGEKMTVEPGISVEETTRLAIKSEMYPDDRLLAEIQSPNGEMIEMAPAGRVAVGAHRQIASRYGSVHSREKKPENSNPTTFRGAGFAWGLSGIYCLKAKGLDILVDEIFEKTNPCLEREFNTLISCVVKDPKYCQHDPEDEFACNGIPSFFMNR
ncbi:MAG: hypothetical protein ACYC0V_01605 [Armatimonadota bacterium]